MMARDERSTKGLLRDREFRQRGRITSYNVCYTKLLRSFSAGFLAARGKGFSVAEALSFAGALADFVVSRPGAIPDYDAALKARLAPIMG